jgi:hypothetical protein
MKSVDESRFSDACLSGDKDELSLATQSAGETDVKLSKPVFRPTILLVSEPGKAAALSSLTGAIN